LHYETNLERLKRYFTRFYI